MPTTPPPPSTPPPASGGLACGAERWSVTTLSDPDALKVDLAQAVPTTIAALNALPPHCGGAPDRRTFPEEFRTYEVVGRVSLVRLQPDHDYHVVLADPQTEDTIVVEVIDPAYSGAAQSSYVGTLSQVRATFAAAGNLEGQLVRVRGVGFFDFDHNQSGRSRSCIELHPVVGIERAS